MLKISNAIKKIIENQPFLSFGLHHRLLNLSAVARFIEPLIEAQTKKGVQPTAILMGLSRLQKKLAGKTPKIKDLAINNLIIHSNLCAITFLKNNNIFNSLNKFYENIQNQDGYFALSQGTSEITIIANESFLPLLQKVMCDKPKHIKKGLSSIGIQFDPKYVEIPGLLYYLTQAITLQNINIWESSSTYTELIFYIDKDDVRLAFDTLSELLRKRGVLGVGN